MSYHQLSKEESELAQRARHDAMKRAWLKPRIKRKDDTWVCCGRGVTATGHSPTLAYSAWQVGQQTRVIYAQAGKAAAQCMTDFMESFIQ